MDKIVWIEKEDEGVCPFCHKAEGYTPKLRFRLPKGALSKVGYFFPWILGVMWASWAVVDLIQAYVPQFGLMVIVALVIWVILSFVIVLTQRE